MPKQAITFTGFRKMDKALKKGANRAVMEKHIGKATGRIVKILEASIRQEIKRGVKPGNAELTIAIKGSDAPLKGATAQLFNAIKGEQTAWNKGFVGVNRKDKGFDIAKTIHDGAKIKVTDRMRNMFRILWLASEARKRGTAMPTLTGRTAELWEASKSKEFFPLRADTTTIRIPPRRFITKVVRGKKARNLAQREWTRGLEAMNKEVAAG